MHTRQLSLFGILTLTFAHTSGGQQLMVSDSAARKLLGEARTLRCSFDSGIGFEYGESTRPNTVPLFRPQPLTPRSYVNPDVIYEIDRARNTARLMYAETGSTTVAVVSSPPLADSLQPLEGHVGNVGGALHFLQITMHGDVAVLSVFPNRAPNSMFELVAVLTRHLTWFGGVSVSQHYGRCKVLFG